MPALPTRRLLIVDDERDLVRPLALRVGALGGWTVEAAYDGEHGLEKAARFRPDVVLIDLAMPGLDGWEVARRLRENPLTSGARLIVMTAWLSPDLGRRAREAGISELLLKPFEEADLLKALEAREVH